MSEGGVTYCGELDNGIEKNGIGLLGFSAVPMVQLRYAVDFAGKYALQKWNPEIGKEKLDAALKIYAQFKRGKKVPGATLEGFERRITLLRRRLERWDGLSTEEKILVEKSFPVIYGFDYSGEVIPVFSRFHDEVSIPEVVPPTDFTIYVPEEERSNLEKMVRKRRIETTILPLQKLRDIPDLPLNAFWSLDTLQTILHRQGYK